MTPPPFAACSPCPHAQQLRSFKKAFLRAVTGQPELVRICSRARGDHSDDLLAQANIRPHLTHAPTIAPHVADCPRTRARTFHLTPRFQFFACVAASRHLNDFRAKFWNLSLSPEQPGAAASCDATRAAADVAVTKAALLQAKKLSQQQLPVAAMPALTFCIACRLQLRALYSRLHALQLQPVTADDAWCAPRLQALRQMVTFEAVGGSADASSAWAALGFQGKDPCTDFRGSGRLGLESLHVMCQCMGDSLPLLLQQSHDARTAYPFACAVINVVHRSIAALRLGQLDAVMRFGGYEAAAFHRVVASAVCR